MLLENLKVSEETDLRKSTLWIIFSNFEQKDSGVLSGVRFQRLLSTLQRLGIWRLILKKQPYHPVWSRKWENHEPSRYYFNTFPAAIFHSMKVHAIIYFPIHLGHRELIGIINLHLPWNWGIIIVFTLYICLRFGMSLWIWGRIRRREKIFAYLARIIEFRLNERSLMNRALSNKITLRAKSMGFLQNRRWDSRVAPPQGPISNYYIFRMEEWVDQEKIPVMLKTTFPNDRLRNRTSSLHELSALGPYAESSFVKSRTSLKTQPSFRLSLKDRWKNTV